MDKEEDNNNNNIQIGFLQDIKGNKSSGRLIKLLALIMAIVIAVLGIILAAIALFTVKTPENATIMDASIFVGFILGLVGSFLTVVLGSEITQKATNT